MDATVVGLVIGAIIWLLLSLWVGSAAKKKGQSAFLFFLISFFVTPLLGGIIVLFLKKK